MGQRRDDEVVRAQFTQRLVGFRFCSNATGTIGRLKQGHGVITLWFILKDPLGCYVKNKPFFHVGEGAKLVRWRHQPGVSTVVQIRNDHCLDQARSSGSGKKWINLKHIFEVQSL